jgi:hypothetical protein
MSATVVRTELGSRFDSARWQGSYVSVHAFVRSDAYTYLYERTSLVAHLLVRIVETLAALHIAGRARLKSEGLALSVINCGFSRGSCRCRSFIFF